MYGGRWRVGWMSKAARTARRHGLRAGADVFAVGNIAGPCNHGKATTRAARECESDSQSPRKFALGFPAASHTFQMWSGLMRTRGFSTKRGTQTTSEFQSWGPRRLVNSAQLLSIITKARGGS